MAEHVDIPLHVYQVLEEEYISLHGPLRDADTVQLPFSRDGEKTYRRAGARRDWLLHRGHLKNPLSLAFKLLPRDQWPSTARAAAAQTAAQSEASASTGPSQAPPAASDAQTVNDYLYRKVTREVLVDVLTHVQPFAGDLDRLFDDATPRTEEARRALAAFEGKLNEILEDAGDRLYTPERFRHVSPGEVGGALLRMGWRRFSSEERVVFEGEDLVHFKRILLEELFPDEIEKVANVRLAAINQYLHDAKQAALSLSGGGIRSGTFALGLIQGLARRGLLGQLNYLSTVSGGGYIGGWLTAWIHRHRDGLPGVTNDLRNTPPDSEIDPDPEPLRYLRRYSNFITPKVGLLSADTWTFAGIYLRNLLLNWFVLIPLLLGWLMIPRAYVSALLSQPDAPAGGAPCPAVGGWRAAVLPSPPYFRYVLLALGSLLAAWAIAYIIFNRPYVLTQLKARSPFWYRRTNQRGFLIYCLLPLKLSAILLTVYWAWSLDAGCAPPAGAPTALVVLPYLAFGLVLTLLAWVISALVLRRYRRAHWREVSLYELAALLAAGGVSGLLFYLAEKLSGGSPLRHAISADWRDWITELYACLAIPVFFGAVLLAMTLFIGLTSHSKKFTDEDREWWARAGAWVLIVVISWLVFSALIIFGPLGLLYSPKLLASVGGLSGLVALLAGRSAKTPGHGRQESEAGTLSAISGFLLPLLAAVFLALFVALLSLLTSMIILAVGDANPAPFTTDPPTGPPLDTYGYFAPFMHVWAVHYPAFWFVLLLMLALLAVGFVMARAINLNRFSLHAGYRDRLIRGFLGASRGRGERKPNPFTGFDPLDNVRMHELRPSLFSESDFTNFGRLVERLKARRDEVSKYLWENAISEKTKDEMEAYSPDALPPQALKAALIEDLNRALEDRAAPLYNDPVFRELRRKEPAGAFVEWAQAELARRRRTPGQIEQYRYSNYALLFNRLLLQAAYPTEIRRKYPPPHHLFHVVNTTLNLVGGDNLAWQQRKAEPFSISPLHCGCFRLGYRDSRYYGGPDGIGLGTAVATSGAAASSNMGYYTTSPVLSLVLTLFNVRLGWWLGNPGPAGKDTYRRQSPRLSVTPVLQEAFGLTDDKNPYVYLTDGGHFENLALYEMVLRRCRIVILSDAAADEQYQFNDLGNAVRKIRIDLGVPIDFEDVPIYCKTFDACEAKAGGGDERAGGYWAVGRIRYSRVDTVWDGERGKFVPAPDGILIYVKPAVYGHEPQDVLHYKRSHTTFPHETTADQFFDEPQFESYRALGLHIMNEMCGGDFSEVDDLARLAGLVYWQGGEPRWNWPATAEDDETWRWLNEFRPQPPPPPQP